MNNILVLKHIAFKLLINEETDRLNWVGFRLIQYLSTLHHFPPSHQSVVNPTGYYHIYNRDYNLRLMCIDKICSVCQQPVCVCVCVYVLTEQYVCVYSLLESRSEMPALWCEIQQLLWPLQQRDAQDRPSVLQGDADTHSPTETPRKCRRPRTLDAVPDSHDLPDNVQVCVCVCMHCVCLFSSLHTSPLL